MGPTIDNLDVFLSGGARTRYVPEESGPFQLYQQLQDYELYPATFGYRPAAVFRLEPSVHTLMDRLIQEMWFGQINIEGAGLSFQTKCQTWQWLTRSNGYLTNGQGPDIRRDYILNARMDLPLPGMFPLGLGGNVYRGVIETYRGERCLRAMTLSPDYLPADLSYKKYPWLIHYCTITTTKRLDDGTYLVSPFSTNYWVGRNAPSPLIASEPSWLPMDTLRPLPLGAPAPCPYNPKRW